MSKRDTDLDRLLQSASRAPKEPDPEAPFGFDTRVVAQWRSGKGQTNDVADLVPFLRTIGMIALAVAAIAGTGVYRQLNDTETRIAPQTNEYAIADTAIQTEFSR
jgi:hypothetical protein